MNWAFPKTSGSALCGLLYRLVNTVTEDDWEKNTVVDVQFSRDAYSVSKSCTIVLSKDECLLSDLKEKLGSFLDDEGESSIRALLIKDSTIEKVLEDTDYCLANELIRFEVVPEDQRELSDTERLIGVSHAALSYSEYLQATGVPFLVKVKAGEKVEEFRQKIGRVMNLEGTVLKKTKFFAGQKWVRYVRENALKDEDSLDQIKSSEMTVRFGSIFVVGDVQRGSGLRVLEEAVKIDN
jgi:hypothetical protein